MFIPNKTIFTLLLSTTYLFSQEVALDLNQEKNNFNHKVFTYYDKDKSKSLSLSEFTLLSQDMRKRMLDKMTNSLWQSCDANKDGFIASNELVSEEDMMQSKSRCFLTKTEFNQMDKNHMGKVTKEELSTFYAHMEANRGMIPPEIERQEQNKNSDLSTICDANKDNRLDLIEATSQRCHLTSDMFIKMDKNKNNFLENQELDQLNRKRKMPKEDMNVNDMSHLPQEMQIALLISICDKNKNSTLSTQEAVECKLDMHTFSTLDDNKNNTLDQDDINHITTYHMFKRIDTNNDETIDIKEFSDAAEQEFLLGI